MTATVGPVRPDGRGAAIIAQRCGWGTRIWQLPTPTRGALIRRIRASA